MWEPSPNIAVRSAWQRVAGQIDLRPCNGCSQCKVRCADGVQMTRAEFDAVRGYEKEKADPVRLAEILAQDKAVDLGDGVEVRMCPYLDMDGGGCAVYDARPLVCRLLGHVEWLPCPIEKIERRADTQDALELMRVYSRERRLTFEQWEHVLRTES